MLMARIRLLRVPGEDGEDSDAYLDENIVAAFAQWYEALDEALRDRESFALPATHFELDLASFRERGDLAETAASLAGIDMPEVIERDQLERFESGVIAAAELVQDALRGGCACSVRCVTIQARRTNRALSDPGITPLGKKGQHTVAYLDEHGSDRVVCPLQPDGDEADRLAHDERSLKSAVDYWLDKLGIAERSRLAPLGRNLEFDLIDPQTHSRRDLTGVGDRIRRSSQSSFCASLAKPGDCWFWSSPSCTCTHGRSRSSATFSSALPIRGASFSLKLTANTSSTDCAFEWSSNDSTKNRPRKLLYAIRDHGATNFNELWPNS